MTSFEDDHAIAVIGLACRLPGAPDPVSFWTMLRDGRHAVSEIPPWRRAGDEIRYAALLERVDEFDAGFFGMSPREAAATDPRQRLMLELAWEALEDGSVVPASLRGSATGVFVGAIGDDYASLVRRRGAAAIDQHSLVGLSRGLIANRVSYLLGLRGPSLNVDSAQSSSLVAVQLACESLRRGEITLAMAGGVNLALAPEGTIEAARFGALSPDGRCYTFDERANGYVRGEGGAVVLLKPLPAALADGDRVYCVIRGCAVNNDGDAQGLTVPNPAAQREVIDLARAAAGVDADAVQYVELHGTGTRVGDPIEAAALGRAAGAGSHTLRVGSAKTNVGHLEGAAGIVGLLKTVLAIHHRELPASLNFERPNPAIPLDELGLRVQTRTGPWPWTDRPLVAGVSSFGMGGTNCHLILSDVPAPADPAGRPSTPAATAVAGPGTTSALAEERADTAGAPGLDADDPSDARPALPWVLSGHTAQALVGQGARLRAHLLAHPEMSDSRIGHALATTRTAFPHRAAVVAEDRGGFQRGLDALIAGTPAAGVLRGRRQDGALAFLFPGQGSQRAGAGREFYETDPVFADALDEVCAQLDPHLASGGAHIRPLRDVLFAPAGSPDAALLDQTAWTQPALFALGTALFRVVSRYGLVPDVVTGHSVGELTAAHVAGVLPLADAAALVAARGRLIQSARSDGVMIAVQVSEEEIAPHLHGREAEVGLAAVNGPRSVVLSGDLEAVEELAARFAALGRRTSRLRVSHAFHSPHLEEVAGEFRTIVATMPLRPPTIPVVSNLTGRVAAPEELTSPDYWAAHLRRTVRFADCVLAMHDEGVTTCLELGPGEVLSALARDLLPARDGTPSAAIPLLRAEMPERRAVVTALAAAHVRGASPDWDAVFPNAGPPVPLPTYAFQRRAHWFDGTAQGPAAAAVPEQFGASEQAPASAAAVPPEALGDRQLGEAGAPDDGPEVVRASLAARLLRLGQPEQERSLLDLVRTRTAAVLGHTSPQEIDPALTFKDLGVSSLSAVELRELLYASTGLPLSPTAVFDHPTLLALARHVRERLLGTGTPTEVGTGARSGADEPVAIVGMACRFPGGVTSPEELWRLVCDGVDAIGDFPSNRGWDLDELYDPDPDRPGTTYVTQGGFLHDADQFDPDFFGISPREALAMDPQQRLLLEIAWEGLERARIDPSVLRGTRSGVFVGASTQDYGPRLHEPADGHDGYRLTGGLSSVASGRIAYTLGLEGPALTIDTACSSSLVAVHLAAQSLRSGECSLALAGGVTVMAEPGMFIEFSRQRGLAPDGRCKPFADTADGTAWAEGAGLLILERLSDALHHNHPIHAVIRGSAINQDGASNGLTAPNGPAQEHVIHQALANAGLTTHDIDTVEAHGTGTTLGDPIEAQALQATYGRNRDPHHPLTLGSLKSNIGHTQAAAGVAGIIKMTQALHHRHLPHTLHLTAPTRHIDWTTGTVRLLDAPTPWPSRDRPRRAAISSFGISGTNAHLILEDFPGPSTTGADPATDTPPASTTALTPEPAALPVPVTLSAKNPAALAAQASALRHHLDSQPELPLTDIAHSLATTRTTFNHRAVIVANTRDELRAGLDDLAANPRTPQTARVTRGTSRPRENPVLVFPGQGTQWAGMASSLLVASPAFAERIDACATALAPYTTWSLTELLRNPPSGTGTGPGSRLDAVDVVQPALWAVMVSLAALWSAHGIQPAAVIGHSQGEIAAATIAGALTLEDSARVVALRAQALRRLAGHGGMASVALPAHTTQEHITRIAPELAVAAINSPHTTVVSGPSDHLTKLVAHCHGQGIHARVLPVDYASHHPGVATLRDELHDVLGQLRPRTSDLPFFSTLTASFLDTAELDADYWYRNLRNTVRFADGTQALHAAGHTTFIEVSPHPVLTTAIEETLGDALTVGTLRRDDGTFGRFLHSAAQAHTYGLPIRWNTTGKHIELPTYAFQRDRHWLTAPRNTRTSEPGQHPLVEHTVQTPDGGVILTATVNPADHAWLAQQTGQNALFGTAAVLLDLALHAAQLAGLSRFEEFTVDSGLPFAGGSPLRVQVAVSASGEDSTRGLTVHARPARAGASDWTRYARGTVLTPHSSAGTPDVNREVAWPPDGAVPIEIDDAQPEAAAGDPPAAAGRPAGGDLVGVWRGEGGFFAEAEATEDRRDAAGRHVIDPVLLTAVLAASMSAAGVGGDGIARRPRSWRGVRLHAAGAGALRTRLTRTGQDTARLSVSDGAGDPVLEVDAVTVDAVTDGEATAGAPLGLPMHRLAWLPLSAPGSTEAAPPRTDGSWAIVRSDGKDGGGLPTYTDLAALGVAVAAGAPVPSVVLAPQLPAPTAPGGAASPPGAAAPSDGAGKDHLADVHAATEAVLLLAQEWVADDRFMASRLVVATQRAVAAGEDEDVFDLVGAATWGLVRSAISEHPGRFALLDIDDDPASAAAIASALESAAPQLAVRGGRLLVPRLVVEPPVAVQEPVSLDRGGTVLITGGTGALAGHIARHLV
ncbi:acyltransferase domain-containing protein, partial [Frankia sp. AgB1.8]|nr:acyltransferase domain-containing protein [Frankia sp. AgB1.8]